MSDNNEKCNTTPIASFIATIALVALGLTIAQGYAYIALLSLACSIAGCALFYALWKMYEEDEE